MAFQENAYLMCSISCLAHACNIGYMHNHHKTLLLKEWTQKHKEAKAYLVTFAQRIYVEFGH
jgi:hypothetical protein